MSIPTTTTTITTVATANAIPRFLFEFEWRKNVFGMPILYPCLWSGTHTKIPKQWQLMPFDDSYNNKKEREMLKINQRNGINA